MMLSLKSLRRTLTLKFLFSFVVLTMADFVTVAVFNYAHETMIPKAMLESEGIICYVKDEISMYIQPFFSLNGAGVKLQVSKEDAEDAIRILQERGYLTEQDSNAD